MDNLRLVLFFTLAAVLLLLYQAWVQDYGPIGGPPPVAQNAQGTAPSGGGIGEKEGSIPPTASASSTSKTNNSPDNAVPIPGALSNAPANAGTVRDTIRVETDLLSLEIAQVGGAIVSARLLAYPQTPADPDTKFRLLKPEPPNLFIIESGLRGGESGPLPPDTRSLQFQSAETSYRLPEGQEALEVQLTWSDPAGVEIHRLYRFTRGSYVIDLTQKVVNNTPAPLAARAFSQVIRTELYDPEASSFIYTYTGAVYYTPEAKYHRAPFNKMKEDRLSLETSDGWVAIIQHYFLAAILPPPSQPQTFFTSAREDGKYLIGTYTSPVTIPAGATHPFHDRIFVGPKLQDTLASVAPGLDLAVDYGLLTIIAQPIYWLLSKIHALVGNWGWAIIILTILIKAAFYKLSETSYKSMANMRKITPRIQALKDRYGDDKERLNQAMMEMYKKEKINPLGGCLPILIQIPVFIALYWVLLESVEMRQAPFMLWINNLSAPDPYFVLPLIMGVSMYIQQKLNPAPPDPIQAKVMMSLPFVFTVFFAFFPAGLVLYWVVNNLLSIAQQWYITDKIEKAATKH
ncbi:MAG TPA: membrane protein insertase YidC [Chromatiaceae bacterium]|nr:membrane protein insertase YidC [Chromatiaceae bacterium]